MLPAATRLLNNRGTRFWIVRACEIAAQSFRSLKSFFGSCRPSSGWAIPPSKLQRRPACQGHERYDTAMMRVLLQPCRTSHDFRKGHRMRTAQAQAHPGLPRLVCACRTGLDVGATGDARRTAASAQTPREATRREHPASILRK